MRTPDLPSRAPRRSRWALATPPGPRELYSEEIVRLQHLLDACAALTALPAAGRWSRLQERTADAALRRMLEALDIIEAVVTWRLVAVRKRLMEGS